MNAPAKIKADTSPLALLREPFPAHQISKLPKETRAQIDGRKADKSLMVFNCKVCGGHHHKNAVHLDYVGHAALTDRLLDADIAWSWEPLAFGPDGLPAVDRNGGLWIRLTVDGVTRLGYGHAGDKNGGDAVKETIGDALRNAAMRFGAALDLWHKGDLHVEEADEGQSQQGAVSPPAAMPDAEYTRLVQLVEATNTNVPTMFKALGIRRDTLRDLDMGEYEKALSALNAKLAKMAKAETDALVRENA